MSLKVSIALCILALVAAGPKLVSTQQTYCSWVDRHWPEKACREIPGNVAQCYAGEVAACCNEKQACARYNCGTSPRLYYTSDCPWSNYYLACCPKYW